MSNKSVSTEAAAQEREGTQLRPAVGPQDHVQGGSGAAITLVEYGDYQCPYCGRAYPIVKALQQQLGDRMRFVFRNFPLNELHPHALHAAEATESVAAHFGPDAYWAMHDLLYKRQREWVHLPTERFPEYAALVGARADQVSRDLAEGVHEKRVRADFMSGVRSGVNGTPTFFVDGRRFDGDWTDPEAFLEFIESAGEVGSSA